MSDTNERRNFWLSTILIIASLVVGILFTEFGYRYILYNENPDKFLFAWNRDHPSFGVYSVSHWEFDKEHGFSYPPGRKINLTMVADGKVNGCAEINTINALGNIGQLKGDYDTADIRITLFGDSFPAFSINAMTFPFRLQEDLTEKLKKSVHILNYGRDGTGIVQIFKMAAARTTERKPDFAIVTFTTDDLTRVPIWRTATKINGEERILTTIVPEATPPAGTYQDTFVVDSRAHAEWCERVRASGEADDVVRALEYKYRRMARESGYSFPDPLSLTHSFLFSKLIHGNAYFTSEERFTIPRLTLKDYAESDTVVESVKTLNGLGIPYIIVHLPISDEIVSGKKAILNTHEQGLWDSLEVLAGRKILAVSDFIDKPLDDPYLMDASPTNKHPSPWGMQLYANAITRMLEKEGLIQGK